MERYLGEWISFLPAANGMAVRSAVDAAAQAALAYRNQGLRGSALRCATRAEALADQCGGASTPALRQASEPVPLTDREREIVMLKVTSTGPCQRPEPPAATNSPP